jgi:hypothetical protein
MPPSPQDVADTLNRWLAFGMTIATILSGIVAWGFATGRFAAKREADSKALQDRVDALERAVQDKADCDTVAALAADFREVRNHGERLARLEARIEWHGKGRQGT